MFTDQDCGSVSQSALDLNQKRFFAFLRSFLRSCGCVGENHGASNYCLFGAAIHGARKGNCGCFASDSPTDDLVIADLKYRKLIIVVLVAIET